MAVYGRMQGQESHLQSRLEKLDLVSGRSEPNLCHTPLDGLAVGSVGDPCDVFSWTVGHSMATVASGLASMIMEEQ